VVLGGVAATPLLTHAGEDFGGRLLPAHFADFAAAVAQRVQVRDDAQVSAHYRRGLVRTLVERACTEAAAA
jgi:CO/xanthine dehydrogenase FAD-binding subunit